MTPPTPQRLELREQMAELPLVAPTGQREPVMQLQGRALGVNTGVPLNLDWIDGVRINTSAVERRAATLLARRTVKKDWQVAWLLRAITCMDLTTLAGDDSDERVPRLCAKAMQAVSGGGEALPGIEALPGQGAARCVFLPVVVTAA